MSLQYPVRKCWMKRGSQKKLPAFAAPQRDYLHWVGALNWANNRVFLHKVERKNSDSFIGFLEQLFVHHYPTGRVVLVLDNASYHHSAAVQAMLSLLEHRVYVFWLPAYCPELNLIERFWLFLKSTATSNKLFPSPQALEENVMRLVAHQNTLDSAIRMTFSKDFQ